MSHFREETVMRRPFSTPALALRALTLSAATLFGSVAMASRRSL